MTPSQVVLAAVQVTGHQILVRLAQQTKGTQAVTISTLTQTMPGQVAAAHLPMAQMAVSALVFLVLAAMGFHQASQVRLFTVVVAVVAVLVLCQDTAQVAQAASAAAVKAAAQTEQQ